jgi:hypothetical protein
MRYSNIPFFRKVLLSALIIVLTFTLSSCSTTKAAFLTSSVVPAAKGIVKVKKDDNNNYSIEIDIDDLAEPNRLTPPKTVYIVWLETNTSVVKNIGQIKTSTSLLSSKLKASFESVSALKPLKIFITAEDDFNVQYPLGVLVLTTTVF